MTTERGEASRPNIVRRTVARVTAIIAWVQQFKAVRVVMSYSARRGPILAAGLGYHSLFAGFSALWVGFSIAGLVVSGNLGLREEVLRILREAIPGLIADESGTGALDPELLLSASVYGVSGVIAVVGLVYTALSWPAAVGDAVRAVAGLPPLPTNAVLQRLRDLAFGIGLVILLAITALLSVAATGASGLLVEWLGWDSTVAIAASRTGTILAALLLEAAALVGIYRVLAGLRVTRRILTQGVLVGTIGLLGITIGGSLLLRGAGGNPLIASFAVIAGLLIFFSLVGQVILIGAAWISVSAADAGITPFAHEEPSADADAAADAAPVAAPARGPDAG